MLKLLRDIRFWILIFFIIRLFGITLPPLEIEHNWRQSTVAMVARNFLEIDNNIFYPRVDFAGEKSGICGMEFPLLNYLIYLFSEIFSYQHWYGRLINLIVSSIGLLLFHKLIRKYFSGEVALYSTILLTFSVWFAFSRKIMPDTFSMSMILGSLYYGSNYLEMSDKKLGNLIAFSLLFILGSLSKLPSAFIFILFCIYLFNRKILPKRKLVFIVVTLVSIIPVAAWYFYWIPHLTEKYGFFHFFMGQSLVEGFKELFSDVNGTAERFYFTALKFSGFVVFLWGLIYSIIKKDKIVILVFLLSLLSFFVIMIKSGRAFHHHSYYIIPFVPVMAFVAGYGLAQVKNTRLAILFLCLISIEGYVNQIHDFRVNPKDAFVAGLETELDQFIGRDDLIIINSEHYPTPMYFTHRKGWLCSNEKIQDAEYIDDLKEKGLKYILILKKRFGSEIELNNMQLILDNDNYCLYKP